MSSYIAVALTDTWYLVLASVLFSIGLLGVLIRRNPLVMFMCIELMLNAVNITFIAFSSALDDLTGQTSVFFILVVAAAEVVVGLSMVMMLFRRNNELSVDDLSELKG